MESNKDDQDSDVEIWGLHCDKYLIFYFLV